MHFDIRHITRYRYSAPVRLGPHVVRLRPRVDGSLRLLDYRCHISPAPAQQAHLLDAAGNPVNYLWFAGATAELRIDSACRIETLEQQPHACPVDARAATLPLHYPDHETALLAACRARDTPAAAIDGLAAALAAAADRDTLQFLDQLNRFLHGGFERVIRDAGAPQSPAHTLATRRGACRDLAVLFIAVCRSQGIAARFVSGYQARAASRQPRRYLHAWPEVYLPGGGWRGYDPTHGTAVTHAHVALAASCWPSATLPIEGSYCGDGVQAGMDFELDIRTDP